MRSEALALNKGQQKALEKVENLLWWQGNEDLTAFYEETGRGRCDLCISITGQAGTGKTVLIRAIHDRWATSHEIHVLTPTHRVKKLNIDRLQRAGHTLASVMTLHSALGYREVSKGRGEPRFEPAGKPRLEPSGGHMVLLVDEAGMMHAAMWEVLRKYARQLGAVLITFGDTEQLPPVGAPPGSISPSLAFMEVVAPWDSACSCELTQQMRATGSIYAFAQEILDTEDVRKLELRERPLEGGSRVMVMPLAEAEARFLEEVRERTQQGQPDSVRFIAARNKTIDLLDFRSHRAQFGREAARYVPGQTLLTRGPIWSPSADLSHDGDPQIIGTSAELTILEAEERPTRISLLAHDWDLWHLLVLDDDTGEQHRILATQPSGNCVNPLMTQMARKGRSLGWTEVSQDEDVRFIRQLDGCDCWRVHYDLLKLLGHLSTNRWASTCHRSQGGEWDTVYIHWRELLSTACWTPDGQPDLAYARRMVYTAATRARKTLVVGV